MEQVQQVEELFRIEPSAPPIEQSIDLRFDTPVLDLRAQPIDLDFAVTPAPVVRPDQDVVIDLRDDASPKVVIDGAEPVLRFGGSEGVPAELALPTVGMWARPDRCLPILVNRIRFRLGGVAAVSRERTDLTELAALASRRGDVDARRLVRLARSCR
jgi:hypothetical protein